MGVYTRIIRPLLFILPPEKASEQLRKFLKFPIPWNLVHHWFFSINDPRLSTRLGDIRLTNPVGLAAGWDKDCIYLQALQYLGFGYLVGGTVTPEPRRGNLRPRLLRDTRHHALINALGFPSRGIDVVLPRLQQLRRNTARVLVNIAADNIEGFVKCHRVVEPWVDAVELNISSPNTGSLKVFQEPETLKELLLQINQGRTKPLFVKLPPIVGEENREQVLQLASLCVEHGVEGFTAVNTKMVEEPRLRVGRGGLSGRPLFPDMLRTVEALRQRFGPDVHINACGGIFSAEDALAALKAGANTIQLLTSFVYQGPRIALQINKGILAYLKREGLSSVEELMPHTSANTRVSYIPSHHTTNNTAVSKSSSRVATSAPMASISSRRADTPQTPPAAPASSPLE